MSSVESLVHQCQFYILMRLEEFPVDYLSLLPLSTRKAILWQLPLTDVIELQDTPYAQGLEGEVVKCLLERCDSYIGTAGEDWDVNRYIEERWHDDTGMGYAREILYRQLVSSLLGCIREFYSFELPNGHSAELCLDDYNNVLNFLCGIRTGYEAGPLSAYSFTVPPRHTHHQAIGANPNHLLTNGQLVDFFNCKRPKVLIEVPIPDDYFPYFNNDVVFDLPILHEVEQLGFQLKPFESTAVEFIATIVSCSEHLEVLVLKGCSEPLNVPICIDTLCDELTHCSKFWSNFKIFKILSCQTQNEEDSEDELCSQLEYVISRYTFDRLIQAYFAAPTDHNQLVQFTDTKIEGDSTNRSPTIDPTYSKFKTVRLENCCFVSSYRATAQTIGRWLGNSKEVDVLENEEDSCLFQIKEKRGQKRKHQDQEE